MPERRSLAFHSGYQRQSFRFDGDDAALPQSSHLLAVGLDWNQLWGLDAGENVAVELDGPVRRLFASRRSRRTRPQDDVGSGNRLDGGQENGDPAEIVASGWKSRAGTCRWITIFCSGSVPMPGCPSRPIPNCGTAGEGTVPWLAISLSWGRSCAGASGGGGSSKWEDSSSAILAFVSGRPFLSGRGDWFQDVGVGLRFKVLGQDFLNVFLGLDTRSRAFHHWAGLPSVGAAAVRQANWHKIGGESPLKRKD